MGTGPRSGSRCLVRPFPWYTYCVGRGRGGTTPDLHRARLAPWASGVFTTAAVDASGAHLFRRLVRLPTPRTVRKHKGLRKVVTRRLKNGTVVKVHIYGDDKVAASVREKIKRGTK